MEVEDFKNNCHKIFNSDIKNDYKDVFGHMKGLNVLTKN